MSPNRRRYWQAAREAGLDWEGLYAEAVRRLTEGHSGQEAPAAGEVAAEESGWAARTRG